MGSLRGHGWWSQPRAPADEGEEVEAKPAGSDAGCVGLAEQLLEILWEGFRLVCLSL